MIRPRRLKAACAVAARAPQPPATPTAYCGERRGPSKDEATGLRRTKATAARLRTCSSAQTQHLQEMSVPTALTELLQIDHPIMCAGMGRITGAELAAAVSEAGGIGTLGMIGLSPEGMRDQIKKVKALTNKPYGVDLLLPQVGGNARKTNKDYTGGQLEELVDIMVDEQVPLFVCAVGVPPLWVVEKLHAAGTLVMNMVGQPKHAAKALALGCDIICAQGTEAGGHTGDISTLVRRPKALLFSACRSPSLISPI